MATFALTYEIITPESAEYGDAAERGFAIDPTPITHTRVYSRLYQDRIGFREAIDTAREHGATHPNSDRHVDRHTWFYQAYAEAGTAEEFRTGALTYYCAHFDGVTDSTMRRIARLLAA
jgi:hypothetical protein